MSYLLLLIVKVKQLKINFFKGNSNGKIDKIEFRSLALKLDIKLTDHRLNEIFSSLKKGSSNAEDEELNESEFAQGLEYL